MHPAVRAVAHHELVLGPRRPEQIEEKFAHRAVGIRGVGLDALPPAVAEELAGEIILQELMHPRGPVAGVVMDMVIDGELPCPPRA